MDATYTNAEIAQRGQALYEQQIRERVEADHKGEFLVVEVDTGDFEMDAAAVNALERAHIKHPNGALYLIRIGHRSAYSLGGNLRLTGS